MVVIHYIASPFWGGGEQYIYNLSLALAQQKQTRCVFVCPTHTPDEILQRWSQLGHTYTLQPHTKNGKFSFAEAFRLARIIDKEQADVLHVHDIKDFFVCVYAKMFTRRTVRLIATRHLIAPAKNKPTWRWAYRHFDEMIFVSQMAADCFLAEKEIRNACRSIHVIHNSIPMLREKKVAGEPLRDQLGILPSLPIIFYQGRICREKGIIALLQAIAQHFSRQYAIVLAGSIDHEVQPDLEQLLHHSPLTNYLFPIGFRTDTAAIIPECRLGLLPSIVPEAASLSLLEFMAAGIPVIASNNGSQPEFATNEKEAILLPPGGQWTEWIDTINRLIANEQQARAIGLHAQLRYRTDFDYHLFTEKIYAVYEGRISHSER